jgi:hypothetical protein
MFPEVLMADDVPTPGKLVYLFFEFIALGFALEAVADMLHGGPWWRWTISSIAAALFLWLGLKASGMTEVIARRLLTIVELLPWHLLAENKKLKDRIVALQTRLREVNSELDAERAARTLCQDGSREDREELQNVKAPTAGILAKDETVQAVKSAGALIIKSAQYGPDDGSTPIDCSLKVKGHIQGNRIDMKVSDALLPMSVAVLAASALGFRPTYLLRVIYTLGGDGEREIVRYEGSRLILPEPPATS